VLQDVLEAAPSLREKTPSGRSVVRTGRGDQVLLVDLNSRRGQAPLLEVLLGPESGPGRSSYCKARKRILSTRANGENVMGLRDKTMHAAHLQPRTMRGVFIVASRSWGDSRGATCRGVHGL
jgi:hypothetical protein